MKKIVVGLLSVVFTFVLSLSAQPVPQPTAIVPDNAQWVLHFDMKKFTATRIYDALVKKNEPRFHHFQEEISEKIKVDIFNDISGVTIFGWGKGEKNAVLCLTGNIDKAHLLSLLKEVKTHREVPYGKYTLHLWHHDVCGVFASNRMVLVGRNEDTIKNVLDVIDGKKKNLTASSLMNYWREMPPDAFLKAAANNIASLAHDHEASAILKKSGMGFFIALEKNDILKLKLKLTTDSPETAQSINQIVMGFMALAKLKQNENNSEHMKFLKLLENLTINVNGNVMQMEFNYPSQELVDLLPHSKTRSKKHW